MSALLLSQVPGCHALQAAGEEAVWASTRPVIITVVMAVGSGPQDEHAGWPCTAFLHNI